MPEEILLVCTGNTCRSPLGAALLREALRRRGFGDVTVSSAGLAAREGEPATEDARAVAREWGADLEGHRARQLTPDQVDRATLVLTMEGAHKTGVLAMAAGASRKVHTLAEFALESGDVPDPYRQGIQRYRETARRLADLAEGVVRRMAETRGIALNTVAVGWDHAGASLREAVLAAVAGAHLEVLEMGPGGQAEEGDDYPDVAARVARAVAEGKAALGILVCGTGIGMSIAANKVRGIRAALCHDPFSARMARAHNDANVLAMGARVIGPGLAGEVVSGFLSGRFEGGRHGRRVGKILNMERGGAS